MNRTHETDRRRSSIGIKASTKELMDQCRAPGKCYDGFIRQVIQHWEKSRHSAEL